MDILDEVIESPDENQRSLNDLATNGFDFSIGQVISEALRLLQANFGAFVLAGLLYILLGQGGIFVVGCLQAGVMLMARNTKYGGDITVSTLFKGFDHFTEHLLGQLIKMGIMLIPIFLFFIVYILFALGMGLGSGFTEVGSNDAVTALFMVVMGIVYLGFFLGLLIVTAVLAFAVPLITFGELAAWEAVKTSFKIAKKKWGKMLGLALLTSIIAGAGVILCGIGIIITIPIPFIAFFLLYEQVFGLGSRKGETLSV